MVRSSTAIIPVIRCILATIAATAVIAFPTRATGAC